MYDNKFKYSRLTLLTNSGLQPTLPSFPTGRQHNCQSGLKKSATLPDVAGTKNPEVAVTKARKLHKRKRKEVEVEKEERRAKKPKPSPEAEEDDSESTSD